MNSDDSSLQDGTPFELVADSMIKPLEKPQMPEFAADDSNCEADFQISQEASVLSRLPSESTEQLEYCSDPKDDLEIDEKIRQAEERNFPLDFMELLVSSIPTNDFSNFKDAENNTVLHLVCKAGASLAVVKLIDEASPNSICMANSYGSLPLHLFCGREHSQESATVIEYLIRRYPEACTSQSQYGDVPIHRAIVNSASEEILNLLINASPESCLLKDADGNMPLHLAAGYNASLSTIEALVAAAPSVCSIRGQDNKLPIHLALEFGASVEVLNCLLSNDYNSMTEKGNDGNTILHLAILYHSHYSIVEKILCDSKSLIMEKNDDGNLPLHLAVTGSELDIVELLVAASPANIIERNYSGSTPLHLASWSDASFDIIEMLIRFWPDSVYEKDAIGNTALHLHLAAASSSGARGLKTGVFLSSEDKSKANIVDLFLSLYPDSCLEKTKFGDLPIHTALENGASALVIQTLLTTAPSCCMERNNDGNLPVHLAIKHAASGDAVHDLVTVAPESCLVGDSDGNLPIHLAVLYKSAIEVFDLLLSASPDCCKERNNDGNTALHLAANEGSVVIIHQLIDAAPSSCLEKNSDMNTPLHLAAKSATSMVIQLLIDVSPEACLERNKSGNTPLHRAIAYNSSPEVIKALIRASPSSCTVKNEDLELPLHVCANYDSPVNVMEALIDQYPEGCLEKNLDGMTCLHLLLQHRSSEQAISIVLSVCRECCLVQNSAGMIPLHIAVSKASPEIVEQIINAEVKATEMKDFEGNTALHICARDSLIENMHVLLSFSPNLCLVKNNDGNTPLHLSSKEGSIEVINILLSAAPSAALERNNSGNTPLHRALAYNTAEVIEHLAQAQPESCSILNEDKEAPLHVACAYNSSPAIIRILLGIAPQVCSLKNADCFTPLQIGATNGLSVESFALVLESDLDRALDENDHGDVALHVAVAACASYEIVDLLVSAAIDACLTQNNDGDLPIHIALRNNNELAIIELLVNSAPQCIFQQNFSKQIPLVVALTRPVDSDIISFVVKMTPSSGVNGMSILHHAIASNLPSEMIIDLIAIYHESCSEISAVNDSGASPLHAALANNMSHEVIMALVREAPNMLRIEEETLGRLPLHIAIESNASVDTILELLSADPSACLETDSDGNAPIHLAIYRSFSEEILLRLVEVAPDSCLLRNREGNSPLHILVDKHEAISMAVITTILKAGPEACMSQENGHGYTPLHIAVENGQPFSIVDALVSCSPPACLVKNYDGAIPLHIALDHGHSSSEIILCLINGAPASCSERRRGEFLTLPLALALEANAPVEVISALVAAAPQSCYEVSSDEEVPLLHYALHYKASALVIRELLNAAPETALAKDSTAKVALHVAVLNCLPAQVLQEIIEVSPMSCLSKDIESKTPLALALKNFPVQFDIVRLLAASAPGSCLETDDHLNVPLHSALLGSPTSDTIQLLMAVCPDAASLKNEDGNLPLHLAIIGKASFEIIQLLVVNYIPGCRLRNLDKLTPLQLAFQMKSAPEIIKFLVWHDMPIDSTGLSRGHAMSWPLVLDPQVSTLTVEDLVDFVEIVFEKYATTLVARTALAMCKDSKGRSILVLVDKRIKSLFHEYILFCGRFSLITPPIYQSTTSLVVEALDYQILDEYWTVYSKTCTISGLMTINNFKAAVEVIRSEIFHIPSPVMDDVVEEDFVCYDSSHSGVMPWEDFFDYCVTTYGEARRVALKFMKSPDLKNNKDSPFDNEIRFRKDPQFGLDEQYIIGSLPSPDTTRYQRDAHVFSVNSFTGGDAINLSPFAHCLVMPAGDRSLKSIIREEIISAEKRLKYAGEVLENILHLHSHGVVHGNIQLSNAIRLNQKIHLIDFKSAISLHPPRDIPNQKSTFLGSLSKLGGPGILPPEMFTELKTEGEYLSYCEYWGESLKKYECLLPYVPNISDQQGNSKMRVFVIRSYDSSNDLENGRDSGPEMSPQSLSSNKVEDSEKRRLPYQLISSVCEELFTGSEDAFKIDAWAYGLLLFQILGDSPLFSITERGDIDRNQPASVDYVFSFLKGPNAQSMINNSIDALVTRKNLSPVLGTLLKQLLNVNPAERCSLLEAKKLLTKNMELSPPLVVNKPSEFFDDSALILSVLRKSEDNSEKLRQQALVDFNSRRLENVSENKAAVFEKISESLLRSIIPSSPRGQSFDVPYFILLTNRELKRTGQFTPSNRSTFSVKAMNSVEQALAWHDKLVNFCRKVEETLTKSSEHSVAQCQQIAQDFFKGETIYLYLVDELTLLPVIPEEYGGGYPLKIDAGSVLKILPLVKLGWKAMATDNDLKCIENYLGMGAASGSTLPDKFLDRMQRMVAYIDRFNLMQDVEKLQLYYGLLESENVTQKPDSLIPARQISSSTPAVNKPAAVGKVIRQAIEELGSIFLANGSSSLGGLLRVLFHYNGKNFTGWTERSQIELLITEGASEDIPPPTKLEDSSRAASLKHSKIEDKVEIKKEEKHALGNIVVEIKEVKGENDHNSNEIVNKETEKLESEAPDSIANQIENKGNEQIAVENPALSISDDEVQAFLEEEIKESILEFIDEVIEGVTAAKNEKSELDVYPQTSEKIIYQENPAKSLSVSARNQSKKDAPIEREISPLPDDSVALMDGSRPVSLEVKLTTIYPEPSNLSSLAMGASMRGRTSFTMAKPQRGNSMIGRKSLSQSFMQNSNSSIKDSSSNSEESIKNIDDLPDVQVDFGSTYDQLDDLVPISSPINARHDTQATFARDPNVALTQLDPNASVEMQTVLSPANSESTLDSPRAMVAAPMVSETRLAQSASGSEEVVVPKHEVQVQRPPHVRENSTSLYSPLTSRSQSPYNMFMTKEHIAATSFVNLSDEVFTDAEEPPVKTGVILAKNPYVPFLKGTNYYFVLEKGTIRYYDPQPGVFNAAKAKLRGTVANLKWKSVQTQGRQVVIKGTAGIKLDLRFDEVDVRDEWVEALGLHINYARSIKDE